jgi:hypothetical protein
MASPETSAKFDARFWLMVVGVVAAIAIGGVLVS